VHPGEGRGGWRGPIDLYLAVGGPQGTEPFHLVYGDYIDGRIWPLRRQDGHIENRLLAVSPTFITSFGEDESGEIYVLTSDGPTYVLEDIPSDAEPEQIPLTLSTSGLFSDITSQTPSSGLIPYSVNTQLWSDGACKTRLMALPNQQLVGFSPDGPWRFPHGTVFVKNFYLEMVKGDPESRRIVATRLLVKNARGVEWSGLSYRWNDSGTDATLLNDSHWETFTIVDPESPDGHREQSYYFPSRADKQPVPHPGGRFRTGSPHSPIEPDPQVRGHRGPPVTQLQPHRALWEQWPCRRRQQSPLAARAAR
jgi:hypothetical protein